MDTLALQNLIVKPKNAIPQNYFDFCFTKEINAITLLANATFGIDASRDKEPNAIECLHNIIYGHTRMKDLPDIEIRGYTIDDMTKGLADTLLSETEKLIEGINKVVRKKHRLTLESLYRMLGDAEHQRCNKKSPYKKAVAFRYYLHNRRLHFLLPGYDCPAKHMKLKALVCNFLESCKFLYVEKTTHATPTGEFVRLKTGEMEVDDFKLGERNQVIRYKRMMPTYEDKEIMSYNYSYKLCTRYTRDIFRKQKVMLKRKNLLDFFRVKGDKTLTYMTPARRQDLEQRRAECLCGQSVLISKSNDILYKNTNTFLQKKGLKSIKVCEKCYSRYEGNTYLGIKRLNKDTKELKKTEKLLKTASGNKEKTLKQKMRRITAWITGLASNFRLNRLHIKWMQFQLRYCFGYKKVYSIKPTVPDNRLSDLSKAERDNIPPLVQLLEKAYAPTGREWLDPCQEKDVNTPAVIHHRGLETVEQREQLQHFLIENYKKIQAKGFMQVTKEIKAFCRKNKKILSLKSTELMSLLTGSPDNLLP